MRLAGAPAKLRFLKRPLNLVDVLAILPYYLSLILMQASAAESNKVDRHWVVQAEQGGAEGEESAGLGDMSRILQARVIIIFG